MSSLAVVRAVSLSSAPASSSGLLSHPSAAAMRRCGAVSALSLSSGRSHSTARLSFHSQCRLHVPLAATRTNARQLHSAAAAVRFSTASLPPLFASSPTGPSGASGWWRGCAAVCGAVVASVALCGGLSAADACGIIAFVGDEAATPYLLEGLHILQNRGYDSAGLTTINDAGELVTTKYASVGSTSDSIKLLQNDAVPRHGGDRSGIAHTRWATHGGKTDANAHPHLDYRKRVALVHNGTIENSAELKAELEAGGIQFASQTDTEVIAQLIGHYLDQSLPMLEAVKRTLGRLEGTWGLAIIHKDEPQQVIACRNGSPLVIGLGDNRMFVASELSAFSRHTNQYISLNDGEIAVINHGEVSLDMSRLQTAPDEHIELSPAPYPHWTIKEIMEQPQAISRTLNYGARFDNDGNVKLGGLQANADMLLSIKHLVVAACGTSLFAGMYGAALFRALRVFDTVQSVDAAEVTADSFPPSAGGLLVISQSGETKDTHRSLQVAEGQLLPSFSIVNQVGSLIARTTNVGVYLNAGREHAVASTKAFTTQVAALALTAGWFAQNRHTDADDALGGLTGRGAANIKAKRSLHWQKRAELIESIHRLPIYAGITLRTRAQCQQIAQSLYTADSMFVLGKGYAEPIAREGALKIKEITYCHAEGYSGGALKHGPFALLDDGLPVVLIILDDQHAELMRVAGAEVRARGARTIVITDKKSLARGIADEGDTIVVPSNGPLSALLTVIPLQLIAYEMAVLRGIDPDKPRHLAKAVTVD